LGGDGNNWLDGDNGDDIISAGNGGNTLVGGNGNDVFYLGSGDNTLWGGNGKDVFSFPAEFGRNVIGDFGKGDSIECSSARFADFQALQAAMQQVGADTVIALDTEHFVILQDVIVRNLHESDFHLL
jgi:Ca2+-binding RTX toxin-like protein